MGDLMRDESLDDQVSRLSAELEHFRNRELATSQILSTINQSREDEKPVFDAILENAARLCDSPSARLMLVSEDQREFRVASSWGAHLRGVKVGDRTTLDPELSLSRCVLEARVIHQADLRESAAYKSGNPTAKRIVEQEGVRTILFVPLVPNKRVIGVIALSKLEVAPFTDEDMVLVELFAEQAVTAIENVS